MSEKKEKSDKLTNEEIDRYSRQILLTQVGIEGQKLLKKASVLIVGAGGLGCPSSAYLAGSGIGRIGLVDYDDVEVSNLHRQILHATDGVGRKKVDSAAEFLKNLNPLVTVSKHPVLLGNTNALNIISQYDLVIDATDNVVTRYLLNDACVILGKPLISGSALQMEGQLTIYNYKGGPCYRCLFPQPPPPEAVTSCGDGGVLGVIPGTIGVLQALEAIKIILNMETCKGHLLLFDGSQLSFKKIKLRERNRNCAVCGDDPTVTQLVDYESFCKSQSSDKNSSLSLLSEDKRISAEEYSKIRNDPHVLIDVRYKQEFAICRLDRSINIPIDKIDLSESLSKIKEELSRQNGEETPMFVICRRGNDSQKAVLQLNKHFPDKEIKDIVGGLHAWAKNVDSDFPVY